MSDAKEKKAPAPAPAAEPEAAPKKKGPKGAIIVAALMAVEAGAVFMVAKMTGPKPVEAAVEVQKGDGHDDHAATVEIPLAEERFQNMQTGQVWVWDTEIALKVPARNEEAVSKVLESRGSEIKEGLAAIFRRAQHSQLKEPGLETINRQLTAFVNQMVGKDAEGHERVERVLIPKCRGFPAN